LSGKLTFAKNIQKDWIMREKATKNKTRQKTQNKMKEARKYQEKLDQELRGRPKVAHLT